MAKARPIIGLNAQAPTTQNVNLILRQRLDEMYAYAPYVESPDHVQELHNLRIAAKRVRYTLELFEDLLPTSSREFADELARLQDELGALHDSEVMLALLHQLLTAEQSTERGGAAQEPTSQPMLLPPAMARSILQPAKASSLSQQERQGLLSFLQRQEQRRSQAHALFLQHWQELERRHFQDALLAILPGKS